MSSRSILLICTCLSCAISVSQENGLPGTRPLDWDGDLAARLVAGVDRFLLREIDTAASRRDRIWIPSATDLPRTREWFEARRQRLRHMLGIRDSRVEFDSPQLISTVDRDSKLASSNRWVAHAVSWPTVGEIRMEGILLQPTGQAIGNVIAIPDADQTPEEICGWVANENTRPYARELAEIGFRVLIPTLIDRRMQPRMGGANLTSREYLYRSAFELGRQLIGYEIQSVLAGVDWFSRQYAELGIGVIGWGEGGLIALHSAAVDPRIDVTCVSGYFDRRENVWQEPIDRNLFGLLEEFGDAELACLIAPRTLLVEAGRGPELALPGEGGAPARLLSPQLPDVTREVARGNRLCQSNGLKSGLSLISTPDGPAVSAQTLGEFAGRLGAVNTDTVAEPSLTVGWTVDSAKRQQRILNAIDRHNQALLRDSAAVRRQFMKDLDTGSLEKYQQTSEPYREYFYREIIGRFDRSLLEPDVRTRLVYEEKKWLGYEVVLDVFPDVIAFGVLLVPRDIRPDERRPVVVCQHGLEGRPRDVIAGDQRAYHDFAARLAERGFVTFAPQNLYIFGDRFRTLQRKANPLKKTLFSVIVPQHQQIVNWLKSLDFVDRKKIAFYGLSYGGKSAMRIPPLVPDYCLSICSADFNDWVWKNASTRSRYSYVRTGEYEIFEFDLGSTFNYSEMAALIAPRPFMVERGHNDGVAPDERVAFEFAKVRHLYAAQLKIPERCRIEWFYGKYKGVHTINGQGTFEFLHEQLNWPRPR